MGNCIPFPAPIVGRVFQLRVIRKACPILSVNSGIQFPLSEASAEKTRVAGLLATRVFCFVDMFDWLLVVLAALDQHDEGYHNERCSRCCCGGDYGERLVTGACEVLG